MVAFTSKDVARAAGVSQSTVSYVMSGKRPISERTRERVLAAIEQLTYEPNAGARALASQRTRVVGLVVPFGSGSDTAGLLPFIETIAGAARANDHEVLLVTTDEGSAGLRRLRRPLALRRDRPHGHPDPGRPRRRRGVVADPGDPHRRPARPGGTALRGPRLPLAAQMAVEELATTGHDSVVFLGYPQELSRSRPQLHTSVPRCRAGRGGGEGAPPAPGLARGAGSSGGAGRGGRCARVRCRAPARNRRPEHADPPADAEHPAGPRRRNRAGTSPSSPSARTPPRRTASLRSRTSRRNRETCHGGRWRRSSGCSTPPRRPPPAIDLVTPRLTRRGTVMNALPGRHDGQTKAVARPVDPRLTSSRESRAGRHRPTNSIDTHRRQSEGIHPHQDR